MSEVNATVETPSTVEAAPVQTPNGTQVESLVSKLKDVGIAWASIGIESGKVALESTSKALAETAKSLDELANKLKQS